jgi:hypothetical protein
MRKSRPIVRKKRAVFQRKSELSSMLGDVSPVFWSSFEQVSEKLAHCGLAASFLPAESRWSLNVLSHEK